jgi:hypothetical protein
MIHGGRDSGPKRRRRHSSVTVMSPLLDPAMNNYERVSTTANQVTPPSAAWDQAPVASIVFSSSLCHRQRRLYRRLSAHIINAAQPDVGAGRIDYFNIPEPRTTPHKPQSYDFLKRACCFGTSSGPTNDARDRYLSLHNPPSPVPAALRLRPYPRSADYEPTASAPGRLSVKRADAVLLEELAVRVAGRLRGPSGQNSELEHLRQPRIRRRKPAPCIQATSRLRSGAHRAPSSFPALSLAEALLPSA